jgi:hypothetical protein
MSYTVAPSGSVAINVTLTAALAQGASTGNATVEWWVERA